MTADNPEDVPRIRAAIRAAAHAADTRIRTHVTADRVTILIIDPDFQPTMIEMRAMVNAAALGSKVTYDEALEAARRDVIRPVD